MSVIEKAVSWAIATANDNSHGYSQNIRWGPSYDCSSFVISAYEQAGVPVKTMGATYTGNMRRIFKEAGFIEVGKPYRKGDVLLNEVHHTAMMISDTQLVHASTSNGTTDTADNNGNEIRTQSYYDFPWDCVLRYAGESIPEDDQNKDTEEPKTIILVLPDDGPELAALQYALHAHGYTPANSRKRNGDFDGELGSGTVNAATDCALEHDLKNYSELWNWLGGITKE